MITRTIFYNFMEKPVTYQYDHKYNNSSCLLRLLTFLIIGHQSLGDGLPDGIDLGYVSSAIDSDADIHAGELVLCKVNGEKTY